MMEQVELRDKVVYVHEAKENFEVDGKCFKQGQIVYVGSGNQRRVLSKGQRSDIHLLVWSKLDFKTLITDLTLAEALKYEKKLICRNIDTGLLNRNKDTGLQRDYIFKDLDEVFYLDENYDLRWKCNKFINGKIISRVGKLAGNNKGRYIGINYQHRSYRAHRIIWCLYNKQNAYGDKFVDHIDRNPFNNHPLNLRLVTPSINGKNRENNRGGVKRPEEMKFISFIKTRDTFVVKVQIQNEIKPKVKTFAIKSLVKLGFNYQEAKDLAFQQAKEYRDLLISV